MKCLYFHDYTTCLEDELRTIAIEFTEKTGIPIEIEATQRPPLYCRSYDILFFDWGGMNIGNDILASFCWHILREATECSERLYIMTSTFTRQAMQNAMEQLEGHDVPGNVFLTIDDKCVELVRAWYGKEEKV